MELLAAIDYYCHVILKKQKAANVLFYTIPFCESGNHLYTIKLIYNLLHLLMTLLNAPEFTYSRVDALNF